MIRCFVIIIFVLNFVLGASGQEPINLPVVFCLDPALLNNTKILSQTKPTETMKLACLSLRKRADASLKAGPFSVINKKQIPPSGSKHDYISIAPYWWPNPKTRNGLPYIHRDGYINPDYKKYSDAQSLASMISNVETLALAYYFFDKEEYASRATLLIRAWFLDPQTKMNPNLNYGQIVPGDGDSGRCYGIIETKDLPKVLDSIGLIRSSKAWTLDDQNGMIKWFDSYLEWLLTSPLGKEEAERINNHGTWYDVQAASIAMFVGKNEISKSIVHASKAKRIDVQIEPDGRQPEELLRTKSFSYSLMNLNGLFELATIAQKVGIDLWNYQSQDGRSIRKALDFLIPYLDVKKKFPYQQIYPREKSFEKDFLPLLQQAFIIYNDNSYKQLVEKYFKKNTNSISILLFYSS